MKERSKERKQEGVRKKPGKNETKKIKRKKERRERKTEKGERERNK